MDAVFSDFEIWATSKPHIKNNGTKNSFSFKQENGVIVYEDNDSKNDFILSKALFLPKNQPETKKNLRTKFFFNFRADTGVVSDGNTDIKAYKPLLIKIPIKKIETSSSIPSEAKQRFKDNLNGFFSFLNNSSIWVRIIDEDDKGAEVKEEFKTFADLGLYEYGSARENFDFNCRIQSENWLKGDHGHDVMPILYGNEVEARKILKKNFVAKDDDTDSQQDFKYLKDFHDVAFRILLIDDKLGSCGYKSDEKNELKKELKIEIKECEENCSICNDKPCKLRTIKHLMDDGKNNSSKESIFEGIGVNKDYFYWQEKCIASYCCPRLTGDFINDESYDISNTNISLFCQDEKGTEEPFELKVNGNVQIIGVRDVRTALLLMSKYKFDMVFSDYLLDKKDKSPEERDYANQLFEFLSYEYGGDIKNEQDETLKQRLMALEQFRHDVIDNRGPLNKLWVLPITGFNQTFIQDLYRNQINLIDYKWNISNGADPITTPWQFLYHLNMFVELQLRHCVFKMEQLLTFLLYTCEDLKTLNDKRDETTFDDFQSLMGSEYATLMQLYGNKLPIKRDAVTEDTQEKDSFDKSVFATYIWKQFYSNNKYVNELELCRLMQRFYHQASTMYNDRNGCQRLNEAFENLCFFIKTNKHVKFKCGETENEKEKKYKDLCEGLDLLKKIIGECAGNNKQVDENNVKK